MYDELDNRALDRLFRTARTRNAWTEQAVSEQQLRDLYDLVKLGPTSGNSCPARPNGRFTKKRLVDYLAKNIWVTTSGNFNTQALHCTILTVGANRILLSNDYPYEDYAEGGEFIDTVPISESDRRKIAYDNAKALYML